MRAACVAHSGLKLLAIDEFMEEFFERTSTALPPSEVLSPILVALAEHADGWVGSKVAKWGEMLKALAWVPLQAGGFATTSTAFAPAQPHLELARLGVVARGVAALDGAAVLRTAIAWGLKTELGWADVLEEAKSVAREGDAEAAGQLLGYVRQREGTFMPTPPENVLKELRDVPFVPATSPWLAAPTSNEPPRGAPCLCSPANVYSSSWLSYTWASKVTATEQETKLIPYKVYMIDKCITAIEAQVTRSGSVHIAHHALACCMALDRTCKNHKTFGSNWMSKLREIPFVPSVMTSSCPMRFVDPSCIALEYKHDLNPSFGQLPDEWRSGEATRKPPCLALSRPPLTPTHLKPNHAPPLTQTLPPFHHRRGLNTFTV